MSFGRWFKNIQLGKEHIITTAYTEF